MLKIIANLLHVLAAVVVLLLFIAIVFALPALVIVAAIQLFKAGFIFFGVVVCLAGIGLMSLIGAFLD